MPRQHDKMMHGQFALAALIQLILLSGDTKNVRDFLLLFIGILAHILKSLVNVHMFSPFPTQMLRIFYDFLQLYHSIQINA